MLWAETFFLTWRCPRYGRCDRLVCTFRPKPTLRLQVPLDLREANGKYMADHVPAGSP
jgi:hypothetical protein